MTEFVTLRSDVLEKLKNALNEPSYRETIESSSNYNNRLVVERKTRIPFLDSQTGVAQNDCYLWMQKWERMPGITEGQLYSYPKKRWRKKKRSQYLINNNYGLNVKQLEKNPEKTTSSELTMNGHETTTDSLAGVDGSHHHFEAPNEKFFETPTKEEWMTELDDVNDFNDTLENDDIESDYDDEEYSSNRKKKKKKNEGATNSSKKGKKSSAQADPVLSDKPYKCDLCNMRYKTRPGLSYHYSHTHSVDVDNRKHLSLDEDDSQQSNSSSLTGANGLNSRSSQISNSTSNSPLPPNSFNQNNSTSKSNFTATTLPSVSSGFNSKTDDKNKCKKPPTPSSYCDFCLGNAEINKKTRTSEEMISCHHCGRSAHPTCLQFTPNMLKSVKKYPWECLECKSCGICGTSDNDDQLLFCDDCDRGYHSHCVGLKEIPEGEFICNLCITEYHSDEQKAVSTATTNKLAPHNSKPVSNASNTTTSTSSPLSSLNNNTNVSNLSNTTNSSSAIANSNSSNKTTTTTNSHSSTNSKTLSLTPDLVSTAATSNNSVAATESSTTDK